MNTQVEKVVSAFVLKAKGTNSEGQLVSIKELDDLNNKLGNVLPGWFIELVSTYPLSGAQIDYPQYEPGGDYDGYVTFTVATPQNIFDEMELCYRELQLKS